LTSFVSWDLNVNAKFAFGKMPFAVIDMLKTVSLNRKWTQQTPSCEMW